MADPASDHKPLFERLLALADEHPEHAGDLRLAAELVNPERVFPAVLAIAQMRGWAWAEPGKRRDWLLDRLDKLGDAFCVGDELKRLTARAMEGVRHG